MPDNKTILQQANAAITAGDNEGFLAHCTEDTEWTFVGEQTLRGKPAVREWMRTAYAQPPRFHVEQLIAEADFVTALGMITVRDDDGQEAEHAYCDVWRFRDGQMAELRAFVIKPAR
jgi:uncharacterized protein